VAGVMDLSSVISDLASGTTYAVTRRAPATYDADGRLVPGSTTALVITASIQPLEGRDLLRLPEGLRTKELLKIYSSTQLFVQGAGQDPDTVIYQGFPYQVETAEQWGENGNFWKMIVRKADRLAP